LPTKSPLGYSKGLLCCYLLAPFLQKEEAFPPLEACGNVPFVLLQLLHAYCLCHDLLLSLLNHKTPTSLIGLARLVLPQSPATTFAPTPESPATWAAAWDVVQEILTACRFEGRFGLIHKYKSVRNHAQSLWWWVGFGAGGAAHWLVFRFGVVMGEVRRTQPDRRVAFAGICMCFCEQGRCGGLCVHA